MSLIPPAHLLCLFTKKITPWVSLSVSDESIEGVLFCLIRLDSTICTRPTHFSVKLYMEEITIFKETNKVQFLLTDFSEMTISWIIGGGGQC